jgi:hypothetical protein
MSPGKFLRFDGKEKVNIKELGHSFKMQGEQVGPLAISVGCSDAGWGWGGKVLGALCRL